MPQELFIHAGAHRTGTSSFQLMLAQNRALLRANGILPLYPTRDGAPGRNLRLRLPGPRMGPRKIAQRAEMVRAELARHLGGAREKPRVLLSEENIPGRMFHFYSGQFFPAAETRMHLLADALRAQGIPQPRRLVYVVRSYAEIFVSAYRKRAEENPVGPFSEIAPAMTGMQRGWPELIAQMQARLVPEQLVVVAYAQRGRSVDLLERLLGNRLEGLEEPEKVVNLSATDAALEALQKRYHAGETLSRDVQQAVMAEYADLREPRGFAAFTPAQTAKLDARYTAHCEKLAQMPGVTFVG